MWRVNLLPAWIVMRRELRDQLRDWRIIFPIVMLTLFFPALMNFTARQIMGFVERYGASLMAIRFVPFLLMIVGFFPITVSLVIALESFAGETERHTIEPLLSSPLKDWQLYLGKLMASLLPPLVASYLGVTVYLIGVLSKLEWRPEPMFLLQMILLIAVQALVMVSAAIVVSTQTTSVRAANLLASFIIIPMALLIQAESVMMFWADYPILWLCVIGQAILAIMLVRMGLAYFNREELLGREIDTLNIRQGWSVFLATFSNSANNIMKWYRVDVRRALRLHKLPVLLMSIILCIGLIIGAVIGSRHAYALQALTLQDLGNLEGDLLKQFRDFGLLSVGGLAYVWFHNLRVVLLAGLAGLFTFGILGTLILMLPLALIGLLTSLASGAGISPLLFLLAFILPHGILEIPAIILTGAAILKVGATFITPAPGRTIGESVMKALAEWAIVIIGVVIPLFTGAAIIEVFVTPHVVATLLGGG